MCERSHERRHVLAGLDGSRERHIGRRDAVRRQHRIVVLGVFGGRCEALVIDTVRHHDDLAALAGNVTRRRAAVNTLMHTTTSARAAAARIMRRKYATLDRSCHSGWSKNVRSCTVTTVGTDVRSGIV